MDLLTAVKNDEQRLRDWDALLSTVEAALEPFHPGNIQIWYEDDPAIPDTLFVRLDVQNLGRIEFKMDKETMLLSYLTPLQMILAYIDSHIRNREAVPVDNPCIILGDE